MLGGIWMKKMCVDEIGGVNEEEILDNLTSLLTDSKINGSGDDGSNDEINSQKDS